MLFEFQKSVIYKFIESFKWLNCVEFLLKGWDIELYYG